MRAAVALRDVVGEAQHRLVIAVVPLHGGFDQDAVFLAADRHRRVVQHLLVAVEILGEGLDAALEEEIGDLGFGAPRVGQHDAHARIQERQLAQPVLEGGEVELGLGEDFGRGQEGHLRAMLAGGCVAHDLEVILRFAAAEAQEMLLAVAPDVQVEMLGQRVYDRRADPVQATRDLVGVLVELPAGMELGEDHVGGRDALFLVDVDRHAAAIVAHRDRAVAMQDDFESVAVARQRLVDRIVDDLVDHVVQAGAVVGVADIHARTLAHRVQPAQHLDRIGAVVLGAWRHVVVVVAHVPGFPKRV